MVASASVFAPHTYASKMQSLTFGVKFFAALLHNLYTLGADENSTVALRWQVLQNHRLAKLNDV